MLRDPDLLWEAVVNFQCSSWAWCGVTALLVACTIACQSRQISAGTTFDPRLVGSWENAFKTDQVSRTATLTAEASGRYRTRFSGSPPLPDDVGVLEAVDGRWSVRHQTGQTDSGTYRFDGANVLIFEGSGPALTWRRVLATSTAAPPSSAARRSAPVATPTSQASPLEPWLARPVPTVVDPVADTLYQRGLAAFQAHDYTRALPDLTEAVRRGSPKAQNVLGMMYEDGHGVPKNLDRARALYEQSARQGYRAAQFALGSMYEDGTGVPKNEVKAAALFRLAADQKLGVAEAELGMLYELGEGVPRDRRQAIYWLAMAGSQGDGRAQWIADWLSNPATPRFKDEMQLAYYIDTQVAAYYSSQLPRSSGAGGIPTRSSECIDNAVAIAWAATCSALKREGR